MFAILRQYALVLWVIVSSPSTRFQLGLGLLLIGPALAPWLAGRAATDGFMTEVSVVETSAGFGGFDVAAFEKMVREGRLGSVAKLDTKKVGGREAGELVVSNGQFGFQLTRASDERPGAWPLLDQLPALEKLWMSFYDRLSEEGWRRIGEHTALEVLSLPDVESPDPATRERFPTFARAALERLPRLRELDVRGTGGSFELQLPPLPNLEVLAIGHGRLEENLRTLADGSPRLRVLAIQAWADMRFTPAMIESLRRMPNLRRVYVAETFQAEDEPAMKRQVAELRRALPGVAVHPGTYRYSRLSSAIVATMLGMLFPFAFWFPSSLLLSTSLAWMLPRRLAPHLFWAMAVSAACGGGIVGVLLSVGVAWMPALTLALLATMGTAGGGFEDVDGIAGRIPSLGRREVIISTAIAAYWCANAQAPWYVDRWLSGEMPRFAPITLAAVSAAVAWMLARKARIPRVLAGPQLSAPPGLVIDGTQGTQPTLQAGSFANWALKPAERGVDRQLSRPILNSYAEKLRRSFPRFQILQTAATMFIAMSGLMLSIRWALWWDGDLRKLSQVNPVVFPAAAWQACVMAIAASACLAFIMAIAQTALMWGQRRGSLVIDFLRPVSRAGYWQGLRKAIALDLVFPAVLGAACLGLSVGMSASGGPWAWGVAAILLVGIFVLTHAMVLLLAVTRWPLVVGTLMVVLLVAAGIGVAIALKHVLSVSKPADLFMALVAAGAVLAVGLLIRIGVLWRLEEREIG